MTLRKPESLERVIEFICDRYGSAPDSPGPEPRVDGDLLICGDEAEESMADFFGRFDLDPAGFHFDRCFYGEWEMSCAVMPLVHLVRPLTPWIERPERVEPSDLTVADMARALDLGHWPK